MIILTPYVVSWWPASGLYATMIATTIFLMLGVIILTYMFSKILKIPEWEAYLSVELYQLFLSIIIMGAAIATFEISTAVSSQLIGGGDPISKAINFLDEVKNKGVMLAFIDVANVQIWASVYNTFYLRIGDPAWHWTEKIAPGADLITNMLNVVFFGLVAVYGSLSAQIAILAIINATMLSFFLPAGIILRFFPPTRDAGSYLIVFAIAFQSVYPFTYSVHQLILNEITQIKTGNPNAVYAPYTTSIATNIIGGIYGVPTPITPGPVFFSLNILLIKPLLSAVAQLSLVTLFLPALSMTITISFINAITKFLLGKVL